ncbi:hypothetical protein N5D53_02360 [Pseudomonas sp. GD03862]|uniref:hypothetical protein n=1 Tax=Pseudomonas sp. GD03862 TaxID=2975391 RepID=UPI00244773CB|nr:hypothetical protein [Pseudomonas sp. GD03862]MDH0705371.1 hypothetical protein [Pseudomonas sp. GD03862]
MPTENRSSNTEMVSVPEGFMLVERSIWTEQQVEAATACITRLKGVPGMRDCDLAMAAIDAAQCKAPDITLADLLPAPYPHPDPIAWMVGTAIWWTKEEAERDAAETGLPIVGLGPMSGVTPEQLQGEPVAWMDPRSPHMHATISNEVKQHNLKFGGAPASAVNGYTIPLYTHADPAEVERLRLERRRMDQALSACANERDTLRTLLVEALAFLDEAYKHDIGTQLKREIKAFYLSASAEPSAPVAQA